IQYVVRLEGQFSPMFKSLLGILTGDPGSPHLWNLFMADFLVHLHPADICLNGVPTNQLAHANDILTASTRPTGFQCHLNSSQRWSDDNGCETSIPKCLYQIFGPRQKPSEYPVFLLGDNPIARVQKACYLGIWIETGTRSLWGEQYRVKAKKAQRAANIIHGLDRFVGSLTAWDKRTLYMARVDPYLIAGCEVCLDVTAKHLKLLEAVQHKFLRRMLGVGSRSMLAVLFSETGIWPIKYRRVYLALKYLCYLIGLKTEDGTPQRPAWNALQHSLTLARNKKVSWVNDLRIVLSKLYTPVALDISGDLTVTAVEDATKNVKLSMEAWINHDIETSAKTKDLLVGRLEMEEGKLVKKALDFRHYLRINSANHRRALTRMVLSSHSLAVERRRWKERGKPEVPQEWRLCRFCEEEVEDPPHAMFLCNHPELIHLRELFLQKLYTELPDVRGKSSTPWGFFRDLLPRREITPLLAKLAYNVQTIYDGTPML
ncbi:hypothetical protein C8F04DRAFT_899217, partial [Mycena alexandri]